MSKQKPIELFMPPNTLKARLGGPLPAIDPKAIERAEKALSDMSGQFEVWAQEELDRLLDAWKSFEATGDTVASRLLLHRRSHDLKGLAPTYGFPLAGRLCNSLCKLIGEEAADLQPPMGLLRAHVDAVKAIINGGIKDAGHPVGVTLANELEDQARKIIKPNG